MLPFVARKGAEKLREHVAPDLPRAPHRIVVWAVVSLAGPALLVGVALLGAFGTGSLPVAPDGTCPAGTTVPSSVELDQPTIDAINALKADYEAAADAAGIPWTMLPAVDYREDGNAPDRSALSGEPVGTSNPDSGVVTNSKRDSLDRAAEHLKAMASSVYGVALSPTAGGEDVKLAFLAYNRGSIYKDDGAGPDLSPYVMNQYDAAHNDMTWPSIAGEPLAGMTEYGRYGAFTVFTRLGGSAAGGCGGLSDTELVRIAQEQLGLREDPDGCNCGPQIQKFLGSSAGEYWCADFVSWVYMTAGHPFSGGQDGGWRVASAGSGNEQSGSWGLHDWLAANGIWSSRDPADPPQPGDVITFRDDDHVGMVESLEVASGSRWVIHTIEGNSSNAVSRREYGPEEDGTTNAEVTGWGRQTGVAA